LTKDEKKYAQHDALSPTDKTFLSFECFPSVATSQQTSCCALPAHDQDTISSGASLDTVEDGCLCLGKDLPRHIASAPNHPNEPSP
jgi:hypothetical protein